MPFDEFLLAINQIQPSMRVIEAHIGYHNTFIRPTIRKYPPGYLCICFTKILYRRSKSLILYDFSKRRKKNR